MNPIHTVDRAWAQALASATRFAAAHPRSLTAAVTLGLAGFGATAFGIAPLVADAQNMPTRTVTELVTPDAIQSQLDALAEHELQLYRTDLTRASTSDVAQAPNMVLLYRRAILDYWAESEETLGAIVTHVLVHEIGHHFGLSDEDMERIEDEAAPDASR